jgi:hypothetical protein
MNGLGLTMAMASEKCMSIPMKAAGPDCVISCVLFVGLKKYLSGYVAIYEFAVNHKAVSPQFVAAIVRSH